MTYSTMKNLKALLIAPKMNVRKALERMDRTGEKILFVVHDGDILVGVVTDGDLRRWILRGKSLGEPISRAMHTTPVVLKKGYSRSVARDLLLQNRIECVPVINDARKVITAVWWMDLFDRKRAEEPKENLPVVIMAGGEGNRLAPLTKIIPKALVPIGEKPILELIIERFVYHGARDVFLTLGYKSQIIKAYFQEDVRERSYRVRYVEEKNPLGTAGSLSLLKGMLKKTFWVSNCDILIDVDLTDVLRVHRQGNNDLTLIGSMKHYTIPYGVCRLETTGDLKTIDEKPAYDLLVNTGVYLVEPKVLRYIPNNKIVHFTDVINKALQKGDKIGVYPISEKAWMDMGQIEELKSMSRRLGVTI